MPPIENDFRVLLGEEHRRIGVYPEDSSQYAKGLEGRNKYEGSLEACERDLQCGSGTCCAISLWLRGLRMCTPLGREGDECHPISHKVPFFGKRQHHTCPCLPNLICSKFTDGRYRCSIDFKNMDF